ncbi:proliferating cell nuclear antigen [Neoconidiobolus thromboides FSU 785]|nr:proliferating cell nuclear antigen [Neoconidiobolus thromboides FSU 785]
MLEAKLTQGSVLKKVIEALKDLVNEANFNCDDHGIKVQAIDPSHVALISLLLKADGFEPYRCDRHLTLGLSLLSLNKILKCSGNDDSIVLKADDEAQTLGLTFSSQNETRVSEFDLRLINLDADDFGIPETKYDTVITMSSAEFFKICRDLSTLSDSIVIEVSKGSIKFGASGETGNGSTCIKPGNSSIDNDTVETVIRCASPITLRFAVKYLLSFAKATPLSPTVSLNISEGLPILIEYPINDMGHLQYFLAPKIDDE